MTTGVNGHEDFESYTIGQQPPANCLYTNNNSAYGYVVNTPAAQGIRAWSNDGKGATNGAGFALTEDLCDDSLDRHSVTIAFDFRSTAYTASSGSMTGVFMGGGSGTTVGISRVFSGAPYLAFDTPSSGDQSVPLGPGTPPSLVADTWYHAFFTVDAADDASDACGTITLTGGITIAGTTYFGSAQSGGGGTDTLGRSLRGFTHTFATNVDTDIGTVFLDNLTVSGFPEPTPGPLFCANPFEDDPSGTGDHPNYGYTYLRDSNYFDQEDGDQFGIGLSTGFIYEGGSSESGWDYSSKGLHNSTKALHTNFTIEAAEDAASSVFRVSMSLNSGATPSVTTKGNGLNTGNFADHAEVQFVEAGNHWQVSFWYVTAGGARTQLGSAVTFGNPNDAIPFTAWLDTRDGIPPSNIRLDPLNPSGLSIRKGPSMTLTTPAISTTDGSHYDQIIFRRMLQDIAGNPFLDDPIFDVWYVGYGQGLGIAGTAVDNDEQASDGVRYDSTCIFDDIGTADVLGSSGLAPGTTVPGYNPPTPSMSDTQSNTFLGVDLEDAAKQAGIGLEALKWFLGVLLIAGMTYGIGALFEGAMAIILAVFGGFLGLGMAIGFGLIPLWFAVLLFLGCAASIVVARR